MPQNSHRKLKGSRTTNSSVESSSGGEAHSPSAPVVPGEVLEHVAGRLHEVHRSPRACIAIAGPLLLSALTSLMSRGVGMTYRPRAGTASARGVSGERGRTRGRETRPPHDWWAKHRHEGVRQDPGSMRTQGNHTLTSGGWFLGRPQSRSGW